MACDIGQYLGGRPAGQIRKVGAVYQSRPKPENRAGPATLRGLCSLPRDAMLDTMQPEEQQQLKQRIAALRQEHRDLDDAIVSLEAGRYVDQLQLRRLKKRKLYLKDLIERLESELIPDLNA